MEKWKVYEKEYDVDGSEFWRVNGRSLHCIWYRTSGSLLTWEIAPDFEHLS
jgi:hypothetical protein